MASIELPELEHYSLMHRYWMIWTGLSNTRLTTMCMYHFAQSHLVLLNLLEKKPRWLRKRHYGEFRPLHTRQKLEMILRCLVKFEYKQAPEEQVAAIPFQNRRLMILMRQNKDRILL